MSLLSRFLLTHLIHWISRTRTALALGVLLIGGACAEEELRRVYKTVEEDDTSVDFFDRRAEHQLEFKFDGELNVQEAPAGGQRAWIFRYTLDNRQGMLIPPERLQENDLFLSPLQTVEGIVLKEAGKSVDQKDLIFLRAKGFRAFYDRSGAPVEAHTFKQGDVLEIYRRTFDDNNQVIYVESGLQTMDGETVIENGTTLEQHHLAMMLQRPLAPVQVGFPVPLELEFYMRADWPDLLDTKPGRFWVRRAGESAPLFLLPYQMKEGDVPVGDIIQSDGNIICGAGIELKKDGPKHSLEILDKNPFARMVEEKSRKPITSIDPITGAVDHEPVEPGSLVLAPQNRGMTVHPILIRQEEEKQLLTPDRRSYALSRRRVEMEGEDRYPYTVAIHYAHYPIPVWLDCSQGCDEVLRIEKDLISGQHDCPKCKRKIKFPPFVYQPITDFPYTEAMWAREKIVCSYCRSGFHVWQSHDRTDPDSDDPEIPSQSYNLRHPSRLRPYRFKEGAVLDADVFYYKNGEKVTIKQGTPIDEDLRKLLEVRPVSPVQAGEPAERRMEMAQCPVCYGWNPKPLPPYQMAGILGVDEIRKGMVAFPFQVRHVNKLELVVFGLSSQHEPTSGRDLAYVLTFRRSSDEHYQEITPWRLTDSSWKYLPRYAEEDGTFMPIPAFSGGSVAPVAGGLEEFIE